MARYRELSFAFNIIMNIQLVLAFLLWGNMVIAFHVMLPQNVGLLEEHPTPNEVTKHSRITLALWKPSRTKSLLRGETHSIGLDPDGEVQSFLQTHLDSISQRTKFANSEEEIQEMENRDSEDVGIGLIRKRSETEIHTGGCEAREYWRQLGANYFPRFVKTYNCTSQNCSRGNCEPKIYTVKVLRRMNLPGNTSDEGCDTQLPEELRCEWTLVPIKVHTYCECIAVGLLG